MFVGVIVSLLRPSSLRLRLAKPLGETRRQGTTIKNQRTARSFFKKERPDGRGLISWMLTCVSMTARFNNSFNKAAVIFCLCLCVCICISAFPISAFAQDVPLSLPEDATLNQRILLLDDALSQAGKKRRSALSALRHARKELQKLTEQEEGIRARIEENISHFNRAAVSMIRLQRMPEEALMLTDNLRAQHQRHGIIAQGRKSLSERLKKGRVQSADLSDIITRRKEQLLEIESLQQDISRYHSQLTNLRDMQLELLRLPPEQREELEARSKKMAKAANLDALFSPASGGNAAMPLGRLSKGMPILPKVSDVFKNLPVPGDIVLGYQDTDEVGLVSHGVTIESAPGAPVTALKDGRVIYSGPFRAYGYLVILEHAQGYHTLYSGLGHSMFEVGSFLRAGTVLGNMPAGKSERTDKKSTRKGRLYLELRRDGTPVNPTGWLTAEQG